MGWIWDWTKYHNSHSPKSITVTKQFFWKWCTPREIILAKGHLGHSYTFWIMAIMIFSPVSNSSHHPFNEIAYPFTTFYKIVWFPSICLLHCWYQKIGFSSDDSDKVIFQITKSCRSYVEAAIFSKQQQFYFNLLKNYILTSAARDSWLAHAFFQFFAVSGPGLLARHL